MAKIEIQIEDLESGEIRVSIISDCDFPADTSKWSSAQQAAMAVHHNLGCARQDLETDEQDLDHDADCARMSYSGPCDCPMKDVQ